MKNLLKAGNKVLTPFFLMGVLGAQEADLSEIFFLDLGIVIEPAKGSESYDRLVAKPSKEVSFKIKKVESGSVYMASSNELLATLDRINERMKKLEASFNSEISELRNENSQLRQDLAGIQQAIAPSTIVFKDSAKEKPLEKSLETIKPKKINNVSMKATKFDHSAYMAGVFAYQREDYEDALGYFSRLNTSLASNEDKENIFYWMADSHQRLGQYDDALGLLERIMEFGDLRIDDALIKKGLLHRKLGDENLALAAFNDVVSEHPNSEYLRLAQMELKKIDK